MSGLLPPLLLIGAGHMGGALIAGWRRAGVLDPADLAVMDPAPGEAAKAAVAAGARLNDASRKSGEAGLVILAVKPQIWRSVVGDLAGLAAPDAVIVSVMAGVPAGHIAEVFPGRAIVRAMPTTAVAIGKGAASLWSADPAALALAHRLFAPLGVVVDLANEALIHVATAASGSAPAYVYALVEALEAAALSEGLTPAAARALSRSALVGAAALLEDSGEDAGVLRRQVTSPGGTTEAALRELNGDGALNTLLARAVAAAAARSRELGA